MEGDTIVALSTPPGESGIAVVRLSGPRAIDIAEGMAAGSRRAAPHTLIHRILRDDTGEPIDEALVAVLRGPSTYTGEDMVEISCHGGMQVIDEILAEATRRGARPASAGEFTRRAFLNGKIDLAQAEAVADLIASETKLQRTVAFEQLEGRLSSEVRALEEALLDELARIELSIDFSEEDIPVYSPGETKGVAAGVRARIAALLESEVAGRRLKQGIRVTIVGPPNVGKSSLYNALLGEERAIVSPTAGTTRDILRERIHIGGFTCHLEDTAGLAETGSEIDAKGVMMGRRAAGRADLLLFVFDGSRALPADAEDELIRIGAAKLVCVLNKKDLGLAVTPEEVRQKLGVEDVVSVSALKVDGLEELKELVFSRTVKRDAADIQRERMAVNARQGEALREASAALERLERLIDEDAPAELLSVEARAAVDSLGAVTGRSISERLLETIFSRFCIGK
jgi:tRNA modification GTPase